MDLGPEDRLPRGEADIGLEVMPLKPEGGVRFQVNFQEQVAVATAAPAGHALTGETDLGPFGDAGRDVDADLPTFAGRFAVGPQCQFLADAEEGLFEVERDVRLVIGAILRYGGPGATGCVTAAGTGPPEKRLEKVAEPAIAKDILRGIAAAGAGMAGPARWRAEVLTGPPVGTEVVVAFALGRIAEDLIGLVDSLKRSSEALPWLTSGWCWRASLRNAFLISSSVALRFTPSVV